MDIAGIDRRTVYVTNAVKHFKFTPRGRRRIHQTPEVPEIHACGFWLDVQRGHIRWQLLVLMGGSAARAILGRAVTISRERTHLHHGRRAARVRDSASVVLAAGPGCRGKGAGIRGVRARFANQFVC